MGMVVDIHCHNFNGDDLPIRGFVRDVVLDNRRASSALATLIDSVVQAKAPGYDREVRRLDSLLANERFKRLAFAGPTPEYVAPDLEARAMANLAEVVAHDYELLAAACAELDGDADQELGLGVTAFSRDVVVRRHGKRIMYCATIFASSRLDNTVELIRTFGDGVDLFTPMLVDLEMGLADDAKTKVKEQVELQERISLLSMLGRLPGVERARVHPFVGFDPRRGSDGLDLVRLAVMERGFVGIKVYPPMGFRPLNNREKGGGPPGQDGIAVDSVLRELYRWCLDEDVPITAHCNSSNGANNDFNVYSHPEDWGSVLQEFPGLHLNLGHFGGMRDPDHKSWARRIAALATSGAASPGLNLYADVGCHDTRHELPRHPGEGEIAFTTYLKRIVSMLGEPEYEVMSDRLMYGTDWYMNAIEAAVGSFKDDYRDAHLREFGPEATERFMGARALSFLGFDNPQNKNNQRLRERYRIYAPDRIPEWLAR
ncbi:MAG: amidohydrolase family protein [Nocardioides sp.]